MGWQVGREETEGTFSFLLYWLGNGGNLCERTMMHWEQSMGTLGSPGGKKCCRELARRLVCLPWDTGQHQQNSLALVQSLGRVGAGDTNSNLIMLSFNSNRGDDLLVIDLWWYLSWSKLMFMSIIMMYFIAYLLAFQRDYPRLPKSQWLSC